MKKSIIKTRLEQNDTFKYYQKKIGLSFENFKIIDTVNNRIIQVGDDTKGAYSILILSDEKLQACYDLL